MGSCEIMWDYNSDVMEDEERVNLESRNQTIERRF